MTPETRVTKPRGDQEVDSEIPVSVASPAATLQSAMNKLIELHGGDIENFPGELLLEFAKTQALIAISDELYLIRMKGII